MAPSNRTNIPNTEINEGIWAFDFGTTVFGIPIRIHYSLFLLVFIQVFAAGLSYEERNFTLLIFVLYGPILTITVLLHELGHALMTRWLGGYVDQIVLWPLGGFTLCSPTDGRVSDDLWVAVMGPVTHIPQALIWVGIYAAIEKGDFSHFTSEINLDDLRDGGIDEFSSVLAAQAVVMNVALFIFNLAIPAYPLDGGRCFSVLMVMAGCNVKCSAILTAIVAILIGLTMVYYGTYLYVAEKSGNGIFIALVAMFICYSSLQLWKLAASGQITDHPLFDRDCYRTARPRNAKPETPTVITDVV